MHELAISVFRKYICVLYRSNKTKTSVFRCKLATLWLFVLSDISLPLTEKSKKKFRVIYSELHSSHRFLYQFRLFYSRMLAVIFLSPVMRSPTTFAHLFTFFTRCSCIRLGCLRLHSSPQTTATRRVSVKYAYFGLI